jgi:deoxyribodipyrimidine photo-lyase
VTPALVWFRQDLRLQDNPALEAATARGGPVIPVFILDDEADGAWRRGAASRWWLHHALTSLDGSLRDRRSRLIAARGDSTALLAAIAAKAGAKAVYWNRRYEPLAVAQELRTARALGEAGIDARGFNGSLLLDPNSIRNKQGGPFKVFTPFWRHCLEEPVAEPLRLRPGPIHSPGRWPKSLRIRELGLLPRSRWDSGLEETWQPGEEGAAKRLRRFISKGVSAYDVLRDRPDLDGTSMMSPWLHSGEVSPRQVWEAVREQSRDSGVFPPTNGARVFLNEIGWREFAHHLLFHFPDTPEVPLRREFERFPWESDSRDRYLEAWRRGRTGYPIVDAGMRQLWHTGWMHNRVRMVVASFLVKHLRIRWNEGAAWFWNTLVDADLANNTLGWQWTAGCGADAAPFFRIFAPVRQGQRSDPHGAYVRRWIPEIAALPDEFIHSPWEASEFILAAAGVRLGESYPRPIVDHAAARSAALAAFAHVRAGNRA